MKTICCICGENMIIEEEGYAIETPNYNFCLCLNCAIYVEDKIKQVIDKKRR